MSRHQIVGVHKMTISCEVCEIVDDECSGEMEVQKRRVNLTIRRSTPEQVADALALFYKAIVRQPDLEAPARYNLAAWRANTIEDN